MGCSHSTQGNANPAAEDNNTHEGSSVRAILPGGHFGSDSFIKPVEYNPNRGPNLHIGQVAEPPLPGKPGRETVFQSPRKGQTRVFAIAPKVSPVPAGVELAEVPWNEQLQRNYCSSLNLSRWKGKKADVNPLSMSTLSMRIAGNVSLSELYLARNDLDDKQIQLLVTGLQKNHVLTKLTLDFNQIGPAGGKALAEGLEMNSSLTYLDLSNNKLGDDGVAALAKWLGSDNCMLAVLNLSGNEIATRGAVALTEVLRVAPNPRLDSLSLNRNPLIQGPEAEVALTDLFKTNTTLIQLFAVQTGLSMPTSVKIKRGLRRNMTMLELRPQKIAFLLGLRASLNRRENASSLFQHFSKDELFESRLLGDIWKFLHN